MKKNEHPRKIIGYRSYPGSPITPLTPTSPTLSHAASWLIRFYDGEKIVEYDFPTYDEAKKVHETLNFSSTPVALILKTTQTLTTFEELNEQPHTDSTE